MSGFHSGCERDDKLQIRARCVQASGCCHQHGPVPLEFSATAAREHTDNHGVNGESEAVSQGLCGWLDAIDQGVADIAHRDTRAGVELGFKGKQDGHRIHAAFDAPDASGPPGPDLGADVEQDPDPQAAGVGRQAQVELHVIDQDQQIRSGGFQVFAHAAEQAAQARIIQHDVGQSDHGQFGDVDKGVDTGLPHPRAPHPAVTESRLQCGKLLDQPRTQRIARAFPGADNHLARHREARVCGGAFAVVARDIIAVPRGSGCRSNRL